MIARRSKKSIAQLSREITNKQPAALVNMVSRGNMKMKIGAVFAEACGYKMVFIPADVNVEDVDGIEIKGEVDKE